MQGLGSMFIAGGPVKKLCAWGNGHVSKDTVSRHAGSSGTESVTMVEKYIVQSFVLRYMLK